MSTEDFDNAKDKAEDAYKNAKEKASELYEEAKESASEAYDSAKDSANEAYNNARSSANEFANNANQSFNSNNGENKKIIAGVLAIVLGYLGIHKFILGYTQAGIIQLVVSFLTCGIGGIIGLIEGIIYLTKSDEEFYQTYQVGKREWF